MEGFPMGEDRKRRNHDELHDDYPLRRQGDLPWGGGATFAGAAARSAMALLTNEPRNWALARDALMADFADTQPAIHLESQLDANENLAARK